ncbi:MAG: metal-dependent hydrolase [Thermoplasmata archaeon]
MDLFTHVLVAYLLSFGLVGFQPNYLIAGAIAGGLPDGDVFLFPLWRRFPILRHHGISHSIFGVTVLAAIGGLLVAPWLAPGNPLVYFGVMLAAGVGHMLMDGFTHFSVPPLLPFSDRRLELDADVAVNFVTLVVSVASFYLLLGVERGHVAFAVYLATVDVLIVFFVVYFLVRIAARLLAARTLARMGRHGVPVPRTNPFAWLLVEETKRDGRYAIWFAEYVLGRGVTRGPFTLSVAPPGGEPADPVRSESDALARSYPIALSGGWRFQDSYLFADVSAEGNDWVATWYSLEFSAFGRSAAVRVRFPPTGAPTVTRPWYVPRWRRRPA